nr:PREDICTED: uncharacterized protein LOC109034627 [Bemisia tabaci]
MKSSFASVENSCLENTISTILEHLGRKKESYPGKYLSRDHISGNLLFPFSATQKPPTLAEISRKAETEVLAIDDVTTDHNSKIFKVFLNQSIVFQTTLETVADCAETYGANFSVGLKFQITNLNQPFEESDHLSLYRLYLSSDVLRSFSLFVEAGKNVYENSNRRHEDCELKNILVCSHQTRIRRCSQTIHVVCRTEVNQLNGKKNLDISYAAYKILREKDVKRDDEFKNDDSSKISRIVDACISFDLLTTKLSMPVYLNIDADRITSRNPSTKGAVFVFYTYARLTAILQKFDEFVKEKSLEVPPISETDFSLLTSSDEKVIFYNYILMFPVLMKEIWSELANREEFHVHKLYLFLAQFSSTISKYYRSTRVLMTQTSKLYPSMFARIYLVRAALQVLRNGLNCLNMEPVSEM